MVGPRHGALSVATAGYYANVLLKRLIVVGTVLSAFGCMGSGLPPSVWPPSNFRIVVEELQTVGMSAHILRRWQVDASGLVIYGTSSKPLVDPESGASWPVFDRLSIYRLEPKCVRALSRRLDRLGISEIVVPSSAVAIGGGPGGGPPSGAQLGKLGLLSALPCFVFGFLDNSIMLVAGDAIESSLGAKLAFLAPSPPGSS